MRTARFGFIRKWSLAAAGSVATTIGTLNYLYEPSDSIFVTHLDSASASSSGSTNIASKERYTAAEVRQRDGIEGRDAWVTYKGGVYDITAWVRKLNKDKDRLSNNHQQTSTAVRKSSSVEEHPGGAFLLQAAGGDVKSFWDRWAYHYESGKVKSIMQELKIGELVEEDQAGNMNNAVVEDPYKDEPLRDKKKLTMLSLKPFSSETKSKVLANNFLTPSDTLYIRNHAPAPLNDRHNYAQEQHEVVFASAGNDIDGVERDMTLSLKDMRWLFPVVSIVSILQCAGNRAKEDIKKTGASGFVGTPYENIGVGMVGNAEWTGPDLAAVLRRMFPKQCIETEKQIENPDISTSDNEDGGEWHVLFQGADEYETSTPLSHILQHGSQCILATHMNGEPLSRDHGYPMRAFLPGLAGARSVKWLETIQLSKKPSSSPWNAYYYRRADGSNIQKLPMNSFILSTNSSVGTDGVTAVNVVGVAYGGGSGVPVAKVEVSADDGLTWHEARLDNREVQHYLSQAKANSDELPAHATKSRRRRQHAEEEEMQNKKTSSTACLASSEPYYGWVFFTAAVPVKAVNENNEAVKLNCRATNREGEQQPRISPKQRGYLYNGWHELEAEVLVRPVDQ